MFDLVVVGNFAIDYICSPRIGSPSPTLGGPPAYVSLAARKMNASVSVISKVGEDFSGEHIKWLKARGIDLSGLKRVKNASTIHFVLSYEEGERQLRLRSLGPPITTKDIPSFQTAKAIHVAPIARELSADVIGKLRISAETLSLDPQGFVRRFGEDGKVFLQRWRDRRVLEQIDLYKSSLDEIQMITGLNNLRMAMQQVHDYGAETVIVTKGPRGSTLLHESDFYEIPACKPRTIRDLTGAGDVFMGAFLAEYIRGKDLVWCMCIGSAAASFVVEGIGPEVFGTKEAVYQRASNLYEKGL
jgi:sugar/nucleoside kinase (ribokinase family)